MTFTGTAVAAAMYAAGAVVGARALAQEAPPPVRWIVGMTFLGFAAHTAALGVRASAVGGCPSATPFECVVMTAWILVALYLLLGAVFRLGFLGVYVLPPAAFLCAAALFMSREPLADVSIRTSPWIGWHASFSLLGYASFGIGAALGAMYQAQRRQLRHGKAGRILLQFPALPRLDRAMALAHAIGWIAFTVGLSAGFLWNRDLYGVWFSADPKIVWSVAVWGCYGALVGVALRRHGRGTRIAFASLVLFVLATVTFPLSNALATSHRF